MARYASGTSVPVDRSKSEIERTLAKYGAKKFAYFAEEDRASIAFEFNNRRIRMRLPLPVVEDFIRTDKNRTRTPAARTAEREKAIRQRWRAMLLVIKAKLEAIEAGIALFDDEWLAYVVLADGTTVGEKLAPQLAEGKAPKTLMLGMDEER